MADDVSDNSASPSNLTGHSMAMSSPAGNGLGAAGAYTDGGSLIPDDEGYEEEESINLLNPGDKISAKDFEYKKVIGRGSFGKVYLVKKKDT